jgi:hypothetical protein
MTRAMITALVLFLFPVHGDAKPDRDALACEEVKQEIRDIAPATRVRRASGTKPGCANSGASAACCAVEPQQYQ